MNPYVMLTLTAAIWGSSWMAASTLSRAGVPAIYSSLGRFGFGALGLLVIMLGVRPWPRVRGAAAWRLVAMGFFGVFAYNLCFFNGLLTVPSGRASLMASLQPSVVFLYSCLFWREKPTGRKLLGLALSLCGAGLVLTQGEPGRLFATGLGRGDVWILGTVVSWVAYTLIGRKVTSEMAALPATAYAIWLGLGMLLVYAVVAGEPAPDVSGWRFWVVSGYLGFAGTTMAFLLYLRGIEQIGAAKTSIFINLVPIFSVVSSNVALGEEVTGPTVVGGVLALSGVRLLTGQR
ncbi:MAG: DMT family transporter [Acidobacteriota bacterium]